MKWVVDQMGVEQVAINPQMDSLTPPLLTMYLNLFSPSLVCSPDPAWDMHGAGWARLPDGGRHHGQLQPPQHRVPDRRLLQGQAAVHRPGVHGRGRAQEVSQRQSPHRGKFKRNNKLQLSHFNHVHPPPHPHLFAGCESQQQAPQLYGRKSA